MKRFWMIAGLLLLTPGMVLGAGKAKEKLTVFYAPCYSPVFGELKDDIEKSLAIFLQTEVKGSQVLCRQVVELGRECDLMMLADAELFKTLAAGKVGWRLEFAHDEMVLAVGIRAKRIDEAEKDWVPVLRDPGIVLGRVNESLGPIGYRTLLVWKLKESLGAPGLYEALKGRDGKIAEHADHLAAILKMGEADYGFLYRTTCLQNEIRFIPLEPGINLGQERADYSGAEAAYTVTKAGKTREITVKGSVVTYGLSIPDNAGNPKMAKKLVEYLLMQNAKIFEDKGYLFYKPKFYGTKEKYREFSEMADYAGTF